MARIIALDYGTKRTGVAVSDPTKTIAGALETVATHTLKEWLRAYIPAAGVDTIVIGLPVQMNGQPSATGPAADELARWAAKEFPDVTIARHDERFTSKIAHQTMLDGGLKKMARRDKALVDRISATIILQSYLDTI
jgi:putative Holliday junction resolvase